MTLFSITCYYVQKNNTTNKIGLETDVKLPHIKQHVDLSVMTGHAFLKGLVKHIQKTILEEKLYPYWLTGSPTGDKVFYPEFIVGDNDITIDTSRVQLSSIKGGSKYPGIWIHKTLASEMGWFQSDPQFAVK